jgi:hypothetical protein
MRLWCPGKWPFGVLRGRRLAAMSHVGLAPRFSLPAQGKLLQLRFDREQRVLADVAAARAHNARRSELLQRSALFGKYLAEESEDVPPTSVAAMAAARASRASTLRQARVDLRRVYKHFPFALHASCDDRRERVGSGGTERSRSSRGGSAGGGGSANNRGNDLGGDTSRTAATAAPSSRGGGDGDDDGDGDGDGSAADGGNDVSARGGIGDAKSLSVEVPGVDDADRENDGVDDVDDSDGDSCGSVHSYAEEATLRL